MVKTEAMKIHLLMTCFITDSRIQPSGYYQIEEADKISQVLSTLNSLRKIKFSSSEIRIALDYPYEEHQTILRAAAEVWHPEADFFSTRLEDFEGWRAAIGRIPSDTEWVLIMANHDHVFIQEDSVQLVNYLELVWSEGVSTIAHISHWTEALGWRSLKSNPSRPKGLGLWFLSSETIGTVAVQLGELKSWFAEDFTLGAKFVRPDNPFGPSVTVSNSNQSLPMVEFFRHLDGYGHVGLTAQYASYLATNSAITQGKLITREYLFGNLSQGAADLLQTPNFYVARPIDSLEEIRNLIYLATAYRVRFRAISCLINGVEAPMSVKARAIFRAILHPQFWKSLVGPVLARLTRRIKS
jgi:hypothetical protein